MYSDLIGKGCAQNGGDPLFIKSSYVHPQNKQTYPFYIMNRDGFSLLVMGFTGKEALEWKLQYIKAFNQMENFIREKSTQVWVETRKAGKLTRKAETDTIQKLVEYAKVQGSSHAEMLYMTYSKLANKMAGINKRDEATVMQLNNLSLMFVKNGGEEEEVKEQLRHSFEHGLMNEEELDKEIKEKFKQVDAIIPFISLLEEMLKTFGAKDKED